MNPLTQQLPSLLLYREGVAPVVCLVNVVALAQGVGAVQDTALGMTVHSLELPGAFLSEVQAVRAVQDIASGIIGNRLTHMGMFS